MNIKTINELEETNNIDGFYGVACNGNNETKKYELPPIMKGEGEKSISTNNCENKIISECSVALGKNNFVGLKGYYYNYIDFENNKIYLSDTQIESLLSSPPSLSNIVCEYAVGDIITIINNKQTESKFYNCSTITEIGVGYVIVDNLPFTELLFPEDAILYDDFTISCHEHYDIGNVNLGGTSVVLGDNNKAFHVNSVAVGIANTAYGHYAFCSNRTNRAGYAAHAEGWSTNAEGQGSHSEGYKSISKGKSSHAEGYNTNGEGNYSHAEGYNTFSIGESSHAEGYKSKSIGKRSHAEGHSAESSGDNSHAEGQETKAIGVRSHAEGNATNANGSNSHAEGNATNANGSNSHAEGKNTNANGSNSHAEGLSTVSNNDYEHAEGKYNKSNDYTIHSVGIGTSNSARKNAHEIMDDGKHYIYGIGGYDGTNPDTATDIVTYIQSLENRIQQLENK